MKNSLVAVILAAAALSLVSCQKKIMKAAQFDCLPNEINLHQIVAYNPDIAVKEKLEALRAHCENGRLLDANKREIRFFKRSCWGNPPANHDEIVQHEQEEIEKLKERYTVIIIECNPFIL